MISPQLILTVTFQSKQPKEISIIVSFVGYETQEVAVDGDNLTITMALGNLLDEVVVTTGYGTQSKRDITGAVSTIES